MKNNNARLTKYNLLIIMLLVILLSSLFLCNINVAYAQNTDVKLTITPDTQFATNGEIIAFTNGSTLRVVKNNIVYSKDNAINTCKDIAIINDYIVLLDSNGNTISYCFKDNQIVDPSDEIKGIYNKSGEKITKLYASNKYLHTLAEKNINQYNDITKPSITTAYTVQASIKFDFKDFVVLNNHTYAIGKDNKIYTFSDGQVNELTVLFDNYSPDAITASNDAIYFNDGLNLMKFVPGNTEATLNGTLDDKGNTTSLEFVTINGKDQLFQLAIDDLSIKVYDVNESSINYVNTFNNKEYIAPTTNSIVKIYRVTSDEGITVYISPVTKLSVFELSKGDLILVLDSKDNHYYVTDAHNKYGYIDFKDKDKMSVIEPLKDTKLGPNGQVLHENTKMYSLPFESSTLIKTFSAKELTLRLAVDSCVAVENGVDLWGWYKVSYEDNGATVYGYIKSNQLSPYTPFTAPTVKKTAKLKADSFGKMVTIYTYADEDSEVLKELVDGSEILLMEKFNDKSTWTQVQYGEIVGYVKTANVQLTGLTSVQIFVITIVSLVVAATIIIVIIFIIKRKNNSR